MCSSTRDRMVDAAIVALRRHGVSGTSFTEVLADSGAARGAIYHHFPGGKRQLVAEAAARNGEQVREHLAELAGVTPARVVESFLEAVGPVVAQSADGSGCAVAAVTVDPAPEAPELRAVAAAAFEGWVDALTHALIDAGLERPDAEDLAEHLITLLEGAHVLCRASGDTQPFDAAARSMTTLVASFDRVRG